MHQTTQNLDFNCSFSITTELNISKHFGVSHTNYVFGVRGKHFVLELIPRTITTFFKEILDKFPTHRQIINKVKV